MDFNPPKFIYQKLASLVHAVSVYLHPLFNFITTYIFRLQRYGHFPLKKNGKIETDFTEFIGSYDEEEKKELSLKFKFQSFEEFSRIQNRIGTVINPELFPYADASKYEFTPGKSEIETFYSDENSYFSEIEEGFLDENGKIHEAMEFTKDQEQEEFLGESQFSSQKDSNSESTSENNGFLSDRDFEGGLEDIHNENDKISGDFDSDLKQVHEHDIENPNGANSDNKNDERFITKDTKLHESSASNSGDANKLESFWEHQELIEQLKMELRNVRAIGLPTIFEEEPDESPKSVNDLKPWKIDDQHEDCMGELHKCYKSYKERMRKFDILNYQKMYAMGFLQLKDPLQSNSNKKRAPPTLRSLVSKNLWLFKHKVHGSDPVKKFVKELEGDLELVYVGHTCLSWEFLHWQYRKSLELWHSDTCGVHRYNDVASEFQQFQVLLQRFIEDEAFQGPRVQNYVKSRCVLRSLLQVPLIREDDLKHKGKAWKKDADEYAITSEMLAETLEESIRIFWQFVRSDKDCCIVAANKKMPELHNPEDFKLLLKVRKILQKKQRRLKDILRSENCILRKFKRSKLEDDSEQVLYFFSQVDMKLVCRVLNMSKITREQLIWCQNKLSRISFVNRKICVDPAFLLFPC